MPDTETIAAQETLLHQHRRRLALLLEQQARFGDHTPPHIRLDIQDAQRDIQRIKVQLRTWGVAVEDLPDDTAATHLDRAPASATPALHQLRAPVGDFVGRAAEIAQLTEAVRQAAKSGAIAAISGVRGMGGIGKTELAYVVGDLLAPDFPDAQIVVDLRGATDPLTPVQALQTLIRAFEREARLGDDLAELQAIYRSLLSGRHVLILADDACDATQIRPLLPPPGCVLLITSRYRFSLPGMHTIDLGTLVPAEAVTLLLRVCPRIGEVAPALAKLCGYLPLALRVSAGLLANDATLPVARYLERLADERQRLAGLRDGDDVALNVDASLALSYAALSPTTQAILCQLSVFVMDFDLGAAQAVVMLGGGQSANLLTRLLQRVFARPRQAASIESLLGDLYRRSLLDYDASLERYSLHDLVRVFAHARLDAEVSEGIMLGYAQHYEQVARQADRLYLQGGEAVLMGLGLFDRERAHIDAGWAWVCGQAAGSVVDELLIDFAGATVHIGDLRYDVRRERIPQLEAALAAAQRRGHHAAQSMTLNNLGSAYVDLGEVRQAIEYYEQSLEIVRKVADRGGEGATLGNLGNAYYRLGEVRQAIEYYEQSLEIMREVDDRRGEGLTLGNLGNVYADVGEVRRAIEYYEQVLIIMRELGDRHGEGQTLGNLGNACYTLGEVRHAIEYYEQSLVIKREVGDRPGEGGTLNNLGLAYATLGEVQHAIEYYEQSLVIMHEIGNRQGEVLGSWNLGLLLARQGEKARAIVLMQVRVDYEYSIGHTEAEAHAARVTELRRQLEITNTPAIFLTDLIQRAQAAVARALAEGTAEERAALAEKLTVTADAYASGDAAERALAAQVRVLLERLSEGGRVNAEG